MPTGLWASRAAPDPDPGPAPARSTALPTLPAKGLLRQSAGSSPSLSPSRCQADAACAEHAWVSRSSTTRAYSKQRAPLGVIFCVSRTPRPRSGRCQRLAMKAKGSAVTAHYWFGIRRGNVWLDNAVWSLRTPAHASANVMVQFRELGCKILQFTGDQLPGRETANHRVLKRWRQPQYLPMALPVGSHPVCRASELSGFDFDRRFSAKHVGMS